MTKPRKQRGLFDDKPHVGAKTTSEKHKAWRDKNRDHVRDVNRARARQRNHSEYMRSWRKKNRHKLFEKERRARLKKYGLTPADYDRLVVEQDNCCAICLRPAAVLKPKNARHKHVRLDVDHCHATGKVRSLLCYNCNAILGHAADSIRRLVRAIEYLRRHGVVE